MAQIEESQKFGASYRYSPWSKRASLTPRKTYSAESKIIYKRRKHVMTINDANRIMEKLLAQEERDELEAKQSRSFWENFLQWIQRLTVKMMKRLLGRAFEWSAQPIYDFIYQTLDIVTKDLVLDPTEKERIKKIFLNFMDTLWTGLKNTLTIKGD